LEFNRAVAINVRKCGPPFVSYKTRPPGKSGLG
jgi:hypothetical protein